MTSPDQTRVPGVSRNGGRIARFVSSMRVNWVWYDNHLPLVPQLARFKLPSLPDNDRSPRFTRPERHE